MYKCKRKGQKWAFLNSNLGLLELMKLFFRMEFLCTKNVVFNSIMIKRSGAKLSFVHFLLYLRTFASKYRRRSEAVCSRTCAVWKDVTSNWKRTSQDINRSFNCLFVDWLKSKFILLVLGQYFLYETARVFLRLTLIKLAVNDAS